MPLEIRLRFIPQSKRWIGRGVRLRPSLQQAPPHLDKAVRSVATQEDPGANAKALLQIINALSGQDLVDQQKPEFVVEAGMAALRWLAEGYGYEITEETRKKTLKGTTCGLVA